MLNLIIVLVIAMILAFLDICYMKRRSIITKEKKVDLRGLRPLNLVQTACYFAVPATLAAAGCLAILSYDMELIHTVKRVCLLAMLWPVAVNDYQHSKIPNKLLLAGLAARAALLIAEVIAAFVSGDFDSLLTVLISEGIAIAFMAFICVVCMFLSKGSIGMGDVKLMLVMASFLGAEGMFNAMFVTLVFSFFVSVFLLISKKKSKQDAIPFAPFILAGTTVSILLTGI